jgi:DnaJ-class molecular chaperone
MECKVCEGMGCFEVDFDYDSGRYFRVGPDCEECEGTGEVDEEEGQ